jgi:hypothetical protein
LAQAAKFVAKDRELDWNVVEQVGLSGAMLEWKADLFYQILGKRKPQNAKEANEIREVLSCPEPKPIGGRLFRYLKSLVGSLIEVAKKDTKLRFVLDCIKEYIECLDASIKFVQSANEDAEWRELCGALSVCRTAGHRRNPSSGNYIVGVFKRIIVGRTK